MEELKKLKSVDIESVSREELVDICDLTEEKTGCEDSKMRMRNFVDKVKNQYCFMLEGVVVKSTFTGKVSLGERLQEMVKRI